MNEISSKEYIAFLKSNTVPASAGESFDIFKSEHLEIFFDSFDKLKKLYTKYTRSEIEFFEKYSGVEKIRYELDVPWTHLRLVDGEIKFGFPSSVIADIIDISQNEDRFFNEHLASRTKLIEHCNYRLDNIEKSFDSWYFLIMMFLFAETHDCYEAREASAIVNLILYYGLKGVDPSNEFWDKISKLDSKELVDIFQKEPKVLSEKIGMNVVFNNISFQMLSYTNSDSGEFLDTEDGDLAEMQFLFITPEIKKQVLIEWLKNKYAVALRIPEVIDFKEALKYFKDNGLSETVTYFKENL